MKPVIKNAYPTAAVSPLHPMTGWNHPRDGSTYPLQRLKQLLDDAAAASIQLNLHTLPPIDIPSWVKNSMAFHKDLVDRMEAAGNGGAAAAVADPPTTDRLLALTSEGQRND